MRNGALLKGGKNLVFWGEEISKSREKGGAEEKAGTLR